MAEVAFIDRLIAFEEAMKYFAKRVFVSGVPYGIAMGIVFLFIAGWPVALLLAVGSGLVFGLAMATFTTFTRKKFALQPPAFENEEVIHDGPANHFLKREGVGGWLFLTSRRVLFISHSVNFQPHALSIELADISNALPVLTLGVIPNGLRILTRSGDDERFVVQDRKTWCNEIVTAQKALSSTG